MRFACQSGCTKCCSRGGSVYLTEADLLAAAAFLGMTPAAFEKEYVVRFRHVLRLRKPPRGQRNCRFLKADGCSIHPAKPTQCRTYPFWPSLVASNAAWTLESTFCPGIGKGPFIQIQAARQAAAEMPLAYPSLPEF
jgi:Fe-S-cluster containining protein